MKLNKLIVCALLPALLATGAYAYRAAHPAVIAPAPATPASMVPQQSATGPYQPQPLLEPAFTHTNHKHGFEINVFRRVSEFNLQLAPNLDPDEIAYLDEPISIGAASLEYEVFGVAYIYQFGKVGNVWVTSIPFSIAAGGVPANMVMRIWEPGADPTDPAAAAFSREFSGTPF